MDTLDTLVAAQAALVGFHAKVKQSQEAEALSLLNGVPVHEAQPRMQAYQDMLDRIEVASDALEYITKRIKKPA